MKRTFLLLTVAIAWHFSAQAQQSEPHGWLNNETLQTPYGNFEFKNGYPAGELTSIDVSDKGRIVGTYSNGRTLDLAEVTLATFNGADQLKRPARHDQE